MSRLAGVALAAMILAHAAIGAEWKMAATPLKTKWADQVSPTNALPEYPRPQMVRRAWQNLNGLWDYAVVGRGDPQPTAWDGQILVPYPIESPLSGVKKAVTPNQRLWYHRVITVPEAWRTQRVMLHFGACDWEAEVLLNGQTLGVHRGGYDPFAFDLSAALKPGAAQDLVVAVFDPTDTGTQPHGKQVLHPGGIMYTATTGLWQTVWIEPVPKQGIDALKMVPDLDAKALRLTVTCAAPQVAAVAMDGDDKVGEVTGEAGKELLLPVPDPKLWTPDHPHLYRLVVAATVGGRAADRVESYFGMRSVRLGKDAKGITRLLLNGQFTMMSGFLDQGFWPDGNYTAPTDEALKSDIEVTKQLGFNLARKHVKVEPERWYYWCDKLGLIVWQDMPAGDTGKNDEAKAQYDVELKALIENHWNHPSILMWIAFNEGWGQHDTERIVAWIKGFDPSRWVSNASGWTDMKCGDVIDMHNYPGPGCPKPEETRAAVLGEYGGLGLGIEGHTWTGKGWGYRAESDKANLTASIIKLLHKVHDLVDNPGLCGAVYTQTTDCEVEQNGMMTYDRLLKVDAEAIAAANRGEYPAEPITKVIVPTSETEAQTWRYTLDKPADDWIKPDFDDSGWKQGPGGFGTAGTPGAIIGTVWKTDDIWLRRTIDLDTVSFRDLHIRAHHDEDLDVYFNGVAALHLPAYITEYDVFPIDKAALAALKPGRNTLAVKCHQTVGGQYVDVGLVDLVPRQYWRSAGK